MKQETLNERKKEISPKSDTLLHYKNQTHCFEKRDWLRPVLRLLLVDFGGTTSFVRPSIVRLNFFRPHLPRPTKQMVFYKTKFHKFVFLKRALVLQILGWFSGFNFGYIFYLVHLRCTTFYF